jgi:hypothetical protein
MFGDDTSGRKLEEKKKKKKKRKVKSRTERESLDFAVNHNRKHTHHMVRTTKSINKRNHNNARERHEKKKKKKKKRKLLFFCPATYAHGKGNTMPNSTLHTLQRANKDAT